MRSDHDLAHGSATEPDPLPCLGCGAPLRCTWWEPQRRGEFEARWAWPGDRCAPCEEQHQAAELRDRVWRALKACGVPYRYRLYQWDRHITQRRSEEHSAFMRRVIACAAPTIGISRANVAAARVFRDWRPAHGTSLYLSGPVGTGKTLFSAALTRRLLTEPMELRRLTPEELTQEHLGSAEQVRAYRSAYERHGARVLPVRRTGGWQVLWVQEGELQREQSTWWMRRKVDPTVEDPVEQCKKAQVLVLDDVGTASQSDSWRRAVESILNHRYQHGMPLVMTGNLPWAQLEEHYGSARTYSRLCEMVPQPLELDEVDWRQLLPDTGE